MKSISSSDLSPLGPIPPSMPTLAANPDHRRHTPRSSPGADGQEALRQIKAQRPEGLLIVATGYGTVQSAVQAMKHGAYE